MRSGELFAGVGGLGMAVDEVFKSEPAWFAEFDAAPSKVLTHRYPDVPNYGDVTKITNPPRVDILAGGFPCQDVSLAGARRGMKDGTRSGIWSQFARLIDETRPDWVVIENVRGLLSADAAGDVEPCPWCLGDNGEQRALRALGAVLGDLADLGFDAEWIGLRASEIGAPHGRYRIFILAWPADRTIADADGGRGRRRTVASGCGKRTRADAASDWPDTRAYGGSRALTLLPTPGAYDGERGGSQHPEKRRDGGHSVAPQDVAEHSLMPTTRATRGGSSTEMSYAMGWSRNDDERPQGVVAPGTDWGPYAAAVERWETAIKRPAPSPVRHDGKGSKARLNPELTEWMMGWPAGWVTDPAIGLTRAEQLKACGNGVVPQQAAAALRMLLARPGVPTP